MSAATIADVLSGAARWCVVEGDCRAVLANFDPSAFGVVVTDPPFGIAYASGSESTAEWAGREIANDRDTSARDGALAMLAGVPALVFGAWSVAPPAGTRVALVWDKGPALGMGALDLPWKPSFEMIFVIGHGFAGYRDGAVLLHPPVQSLTRNGRLHPNEKPVGLFTRHLLPKCPPGVVLDPFCGSGSCGVAALRMGLPYVGIEIDPAWAAVAHERLAAEEAGSTLAAQRAGQVPMFGGAH